MPPGWFYYVVLDRADTEWLVGFRQVVGLPPALHRPRRFVRCLGELVIDFPLGRMDVLPRAELGAALSRITGVPASRLAVPAGMDGGHDWDYQCDKTEALETHHGWLYEVEAPEVLP